MKRIIALSWTVVFLGATDLVQAAMITNGLSLWLRADVGVITNASGRVVEWQDQAGTADNAYQATDSSRPAYISSEPLLGGQPTLRFDGSNDKLTNNLSFAALNGSTGYTAFLVSRTFTLSGNHFAMMVGDDFQRAYTYQISGGDVFDYASNTGGQFGQFTPTASYTNAYVVAEQLYNGTAGSNINRLKLYDNAVPVTFSTLQPIPTSLVNNPGYAIGNRNTAGSLDAPWNGDIAEILIYDHALTDSERLSVREYIGDKYSIGGIPEPSSVALLVTGAVLLWRRRPW